MPTHDDDHGHAMATAQDDSPPGYYEIMETAVRELLVERTLIGPGEIRRSKYSTPALRPSARRSSVAPGLIPISVNDYSRMAGRPAKRNSASASTTTPS